MVKKIKSRTLAFALVATLTAVSCEKATETGLPDPVFNKKELRTSIPTYASFREVYSIIDTVYDLESTESIVRYELARGRRSIGSIADAYYDSVLSATAEESVTDPIAFYRQHRIYIDSMILHDGQLALVPKWFEEPMRYVANAEGMFAVDSIVYRIFRRGLVGTPWRNAEELRNLEESQLALLDPTEFIGAGPDMPLVVNDIHEECSYDYVRENSPDDPKDRIFIRLKTDLYYLDMPIHWSHTNVKVYNLHKALFAWVKSKHNLSCSGTLTMHTADSHGEWSEHRFSFAISKSTDVLWVKAADMNCTFYPSFWDIIFPCRCVKYHHYISYNIKASYPGHVDTYLVR